MKARHRSARFAPPQTRRQFIGRMMAIGAAAGALPPLRRWAWPDLWAAAPDVRSSTILVVLQLAGGNDGLNTLIPVGHDHYHKARPRLGMRPPEVLSLTPEFAFHPSLAGMKQLYDDGLLAAVHAVGYPHPNRSHFRSMEIWQTASDHDRFEKHGWLGRFFDHAPGETGASIGIAITGQMPQAFASAGGKGIVTRNPDAFRAPEGMKSEATPMDGDPGGDSPAEVEENAGGSIQGLGGAPPAPAPSLALLQHIEEDALRCARDMQRVLAKTPAPKAYPATRLARDFSMTRRLIAGGMPSRIYYLSHGGYDTHVGQANTHPRLLRELGDAVRAFVQDLRACGQHERVALMIFSEFGRRVAENASGGTDHGAAGPVFLCGGGLPPGLHGRFPSLAPADLANGDVPHTCDFRSIYAALLQRHLQADPAAILGRSFPVPPGFEPATPPAPSRA